MSLTKVSFSMINGDVINVLDFGASGDGINDNTSAFNVAFSKTGKTVFIPAGTYLYNANLTPPTCTAIIGEGIGATILKPGASVTKGLTFGSAYGYPTLVENFTLDGTLTTGAIGMYFAEGSSASINATKIYAQNWLGINAVAFKFGNVLKSNFTSLTAYNCQNGFMLQGVTGDFPTTLHFDSCTASTIVERGEIVKSGYSIEHTNCVYESCGKEGAYINPISDAEEINYNSCWFEDNNGNDPTKFHMVATTLTRTIRPNVKNCYFDTNSGGTRASAILFSNSGVAGFIIDSPRFQSSYAKSITIENGAYGVVTNWCGQFAVSCVYDPNNTVTWDSLTLNNITSAWTDWIPTYSANPSMTFSGITTNFARYKLIGKTLTIGIWAFGTAGGTASAWLSFSFPLGLKAKVNNYIVCDIGNSGSNTTGVMRLTAGDGAGYIYLSDHVSNWSLGTVGFIVNATIEVE
jgi:hypothetical protein